MDERGDDRADPRRLGDLLGVAASSASTVRNRWARLRPVTKPTPSIPTAKSTRPNARSFEAATAATSRSALIAPKPSSASSCSVRSR